jgi:hypothetical protein
MYTALRLFLWEDWNGLDHVCDILAFQCSTLKKEVVAYCGQHSSTKLRGHTALRILPQKLGRTMDMHIHKYDLGSSHNLQPG